MHAMPCARLHMQLSMIYLGFKEKRFFDLYNELFVLCHPIHTILRSANQ